MDEGSDVLCREWKSMVGLHGLCFTGWLAWLIWGVSVSEQQFRIGPLLPTHTPSFSEHSVRASVSAGS
jgi:hypothetical protein